MRGAWFALLLAAGCAPLATSPAWTGGGMAVTGPIGLADVEAEMARSARAPGPSAAADAGTPGGAEEVSARHVLIMHNDSLGRPEQVNRTRAEALVRAEVCLAKLRAGADFSEMVDHYSDELGASERGGDVGTISRGAMVKPFSDAAFKLKVGELSDVVETRYGFHVIKRTK